MARQKVDAASVAAELLPGVSVALLKELHLLTRDGDGWSWEGERIDPTAAPDRK